MSQSWGWVKTISIDNCSADGAFIKTIRQAMQGAPFQTAGEALSYREVITSDRLLCQRHDIWDTHVADCVNNEEPALAEAGDEQGLAS